MLYRAQIGGFVFGSCVGIGLISSTRVRLIIRSSTRSIY